MKNSEIHKGFVNPIIRDFLAIQMCKAFEIDSNNKPKACVYNSGLEWVIENSEEQIRYNKELIKNAKNKMAILQLIENEGWVEFDVSDETQNDTGYKLHMNFIGTQEEYNDLIKRFN